MSQYIIIYDQKGAILSQYGADEITPPVGVPYILLDDYRPAPEYGGVVIQRVDVSMDPHRLVFGNPQWEEAVSNMTLNEYQSHRQQHNKFSLETFLKDQPILWEDGRYYGVTQEEQNEMLTIKTVYDLKHQVDPNWTIHWQSVDGMHKDFTDDEFSRLINAIIEFVYPYRQLEMLYKDAIYSATTKEDVDVVEIVYMMPVNLDEARRRLGKLS